MLELTRSAIQQYATKFKADGVSKEVLISLVDKIESIIKSIETTTDKTTDKKATIVKLLADTENSVNVAFGTKKEVK